MAVSALRGLMIILIALAAAPARGAEAPPAPAKGLTSKEYQRAVALAKAALGPDAAAAMQAVKDLQAMGDGARPRLVGVVGERLLRDKTAMLGAVRRLGDAAQAKALQDEIAALRKSAVANIAKLAKDETLKIAHDNYDKLSRMLTVLNEAMALREAIAPVMARRADLLAVWKDICPAGDTRFSAENEAKLAASAEQALGMTVEAVRAVPEFGGKEKEPADQVQWQLWFYRACRRIEAYNRTLEPAADPAEYENITMLNTYRESLGVMPLEADARLLQSARRHSKEMADLGYFAHESPTKSEKTHTQRMKNAGYASGYSENIAEGSPSGSGVFWMWFDSPPHHKNMVHAASTAMGAGRWNSKWTQNFGTGKRLMLLPEAERAKATVQGTILPPQTAPNVR